MKGNNQVVGVKEINDDWTIESFYYDISTLIKDKWNSSVFFAFCVGRLVKTWILFSRNST